jgi:hypothetical protein
LGDAVPARDWAAVVWIPVVTVGVGVDSPVTFDARAVVAGDVTPVCGLDVETECVAIASTPIAPDGVCVDDVALIFVADA